MTGAAATGLAGGEAAHPRRAAPLNGLTSLRFLAAAMIVIGHGAGEFGFTLSAASLFVLNSGVSFFFVLSGFILYYNYRLLANRSAIAGFYVARFARIWPLHAFALLLFLLALPSAAWVQPGVNRWLAGLLSVCLLQAWFPLIGGYTAAYNGPAWTLSVEAFFYLLFPWLLPRVREAPARTLSAALLLSLTCSVIANAFGGPRADLPLDQWNWYLLDHTFPLSRTAEFVLGMVAARWWLERPLGRVATIAGTMLELVSIGLLGAGMFYLHRVPLLAQWLGSGTGDWLGQVALAPLYALLIVATASGWGAVSSWLGRPTLVRLGELSYAVYLLHIVVLATIPWPALTARWHWPLALLAFTLALLGCAYLAWLLIESPLRAWILRRWRHRAGGDRPAAARRQAAG